MDARVPREVERNRRGRDVSNVEALGQRRIEGETAQVVGEHDQAIRREAFAVAGVLGVEKLRARKTGLEYLVDIHVEVDPEKTVREGHAIAHAVKDRVVKGIVAVRDVLVHVEPFSGAEARR